MQEYVIGEDLCEAYDKKAIFNSYKARGTKGLNIQRFSEVKNKAIEFVMEKTTNGMANMSIKSFSWLQQIMEHSGLKADAASIQLVSRSLSGHIKGPAIIWKYDKGWKKGVRR